MSDIGKRDEKKLTKEKLKERRKIEMKKSHAKRIKKAQENVI
jgi:hypothetical protein